MTRRLVLIIVFVLTAVSGCKSQPAPPSVYLSDVDVLHYDVNLNVDPVTMTVAGWASVTIVATADRAELPLTLDGPSVDSVLVNGILVDHRADGALLDVPIHTSALDTAVVTVYYRGAPRVGLYRGEHRGEPIIYTDAWPTRASGWLPGLHHPAHPATLSLTLQVPDEYTVAASGIRTDSGDGLTDWHLDSPAPTYTFAFAAAGFHVETDDRAAIPITHYLIPADSLSVRDLARSSEIIDVFEHLLGPYPYASFATVSVPFGFAGMENASTAFLATSLYGQPALEEVLVHEVVHQWIGNDVVIADWRHLWISEGVTTYLTTVFYELTDGPNVADRMRAAYGHTPPRDPMGDAALVPDRIDGPNDMLNWRAYRKGAAVMHVLRLAMGDEAFFDALRDAYLAFQSEPATTEAFVSVFEERSHTDLRSLLDYWLYADRIPRITTTWDATSGRISWAVQDDDGLLGALPVLLELETAGEVIYAELADGEATLGPGFSRPVVRPVGITMKVEP